MNEYDVKRLALVLAVQAEIDGMKAGNERYKQETPEYSTRLIPGSLFKNHFSFKTK